MERDGFVFAAFVSRGAGEQGREGDEFSSFSRAFELLGRLKTRAAKTGQSCFPPAPRSSTSSVQQMSLKLEQLAPGTPLC